MISSGVGCWQSFAGRLDPAVLRLVGRVHMQRPASEFLATGYAMPVADRDGVARTGSHEDTPRTKVLEYGHPQPPFSGGSAHVAPPSLDPLDALHLQAPRAVAMPVRSSSKSALQGAEFSGAEQPNQHSTTRENHNTGLAHALLRAKTLTSFARPPHDLLHTFPRQPAPAGSTTRAQE